MKTKMLLKTKILSLLLLIVGCIGCTSEDKSIDPTILPEVTTTGKQTFGCLIDGWVYSGGRYYPANVFESRTGPSIYFVYYTYFDKMEVYARVGSEKVIRFTIVSPKAGQKCTYTEASFDVNYHVQELPDGEVTITRFDEEKHIISGLFEGGQVTKGRFDVTFEVNSYIPQEAQEEI